MNQRAVVVDLDVEFHLQRDRVFLLIELALAFVDVGDCLGHVQKGLLQQGVILENEHSRNFYLN